MAEMQSPPDFRPARPLNEIRPVLAARLIEDLRRFIGNDRLQSAIQEYESPRRRAGMVATYRLRERQPLLEGFSDYDRITMRGRRPLRSLIDESVIDLAHVAANYYAVGGTLPETVARNHRERVINLSGQHMPLLLEWKSAANMVRSSGATHLAWTEVHNTGPEFIARGGDLEWEVECKRLSNMVIELFGDAETEAIADSVFEIMKEAGVEGEVLLEIPAGVTADALSRDELAHGIVGANVFPGTPTILSSGATLTTRTLPFQNVDIDVADWQHAILAKRRDGARLFAASEARQGRSRNPMLLQVSAPRRTAEEFVEYVWTRRFKKAAEQCTGKRGAILVVEWESVTDPKLFKESAAIQHLLMRTMDEHRHIAAMAMLCNSPPDRQQGQSDYSAQAYLARSSVTRFPELAQRFKLIQT